MAGKPFEKGQSGNPGGRHKGLARLVRDIVGDNVEVMTKVQMAIAMGKKPEGLDIELPPIKPADMTKAYEAIMDRGWGKPLQQVEHSGALDGRQPTNYSDLSDEDLDRMIAEDEKAAAVGDGSRG